MGEVVELKKDLTGIVGSVGYWVADDGKIAFDGDEPYQFVVLRQDGQDYVIQFFWACERGNVPAGTRTVTGECLFSDRVSLLMDNSLWKASHDFWAECDEEEAAHG